MADSARPVTFQYKGRTIEVRRGDGPSADAYLYIRLTDGEFFMGHYVDGMTRGRVRELALQWLKEKGR